MAWISTKRSSKVIDLTKDKVAENGVSVRTQFAEGLPLVQADRVQLQQVILNLIINAVEAMSGVSAGSRELLISTSQAEADSVLVAVLDTGPALTPRKNLAARFRRPSTRPSPAAWDGPIKSVVRSSKLTGKIVGVRERTPRGHFSIPLPPNPDNASSLSANREP